MDFLIGLAAIITLSIAGLWGLAWAAQVIATLLGVDTRMGRYWMMDRMDRDHARESRRREEERKRQEEVYRSQRELSRWQSAEQTAVAEQHRIIRDREETAARLERERLEGAVWEREEARRREEEHRRKRETAAEREREWLEKKRWNEAPKHRRCKKDGFIYPHSSAAMCPLCKSTEGQEEILAGRETWT